ncbi:hypothetical protein GGR57DRAFT_318431 [Xylariaceae sp. FL1272]|nr:hypothetical protein GGR57DRAFT_318431 [Xylariaceae sp. FL1272]
MVSFFGLKIGAEKKKKSMKDLKISAPQTRQDGEVNALDEDFFDFESPKASYAASVYSLSRPSSRASTKSKKLKFLGLKSVPFASQKGNSSFVDLPSPHKFVDSSYPGLKHHNSNPSMGRQWNTGSTTSLSFAPPPTIGALARPSTSDGKSKKDWGKSPDVHFARDAPSTVGKGSSNVSLKPIDTNVARPNTSSATLGPLSPATATTPKSPLGQYELKLDLPSDVSTLFADLPSFDGGVPAPKPLRIQKQPSTRMPSRDTEIQSSKKPPSPPPSVDGKQGQSGLVTSASTKAPITKDRPSSSSSKRDIPSGIKEIEAALSSFRPTSPPSPFASPRASKDNILAPASVPAPQEDEDEPIIRNVKAKRDTLTINPQMRRSLEMRVEKWERGNIPSLAARPKTSNGRATERPPPLKLNLGIPLTAADRDGTRSASFIPPTLSRSFTPTFSESPIISSHITGLERINSALGNEDRQLRSILDSPTNSSVYDDEDEALVSPVLPLSGPLASPRVSPTPDDSTWPHHPDPSNFKFPTQDNSGDGSRSACTPDFPLPPPRSAKRNINPPTPDSVEWPLPSPLGSCPVKSPLALDRVTSSQSGNSTASSRLRGESQSTMNSFETLEPPRLPRMGNESPTFRSFSRPWTPTTAGPSTLKRAETSAATGSGSSAFKLPPRSATVKNPAPSVVADKGFDFGTSGFI